MTVSINLDEAPYRAMHAVLLYGQRRPSYASVHNVEVDASGGLTIEAGVPATVAGLRTLFDRLDPSRMVKPTFCEQNILSQGPGWLVWWMKPQTRRVWFSNAQIKTETAEVPHPGLVFAVTGRSWRVFAVKGRTRPRPGTMLFQAHYWNVWKGGAICVGSAQVPTAGIRAEPAEWEKCFFDSSFTHANVHGPNELVKYRGGSVKFWQAMLKGKFNAFPLEVLVPAKMTVTDLLRQVGGEL
mgnify:CR=1 FL=1|jgi:PRTRC genetic system protein B